MKPEISQIIHSGSGINIFRKTALGEVLNRIRNQLWHLSIIDRAFRVGLMVIILSIILLIIYKITDCELRIADWEFWGLPSAGLLIGLLLGLLRKPSLGTIAMVVDNSCNLNNYLTTTCECSHNKIPNQIEMTLIDDAQRESSNIPERFSFRYNWRYPSLFLVLTGVMFIIYLTPTEIHPRSTHDAQPSTFTISQGLSQIKQDNINSPTVKEFIEEIEYLLENIDEPTISALIIEKQNQFIQRVNTLNISSAESAELRMLLERIEALANKRALPAGRQGAWRVERDPQGPSGEARGTTTTHPSQTVGETAITPPFSLPKTADKSGQKPQIMLKIYEEAITSPHWPEEYNEIIRKYFNKSSQ